VTAALFLVQMIVAHFQPAEQKHLNRALSRDASRAARFAEGGNQAGRTGRRRGRVMRTRPSVLEHAVEALMGTRSCLSRKKWFLKGRRCTALPSRLPPDPTEPSVTPTAEKCAVTTPSSFARRRTSACLYPPAAHRGGSRELRAVRGVSLSDA